MFGRTPAWLLARMRRSLERTHTETCVIERPVQTTGAFGELVPAFEALATVKGRVITAGSSNTSQLLESSGQEYLREMWRLSLPVGVLLDVGYRVTVNGRRYRVIGLQDNLTDALETQVVIERWRGDGA